MNYDRPTTILWRSTGRYVSIRKAVAESSSAPQNDDDDAAALDLLENTPLTNGVSYPGGITNNYFVSKLQVRMMLISFSILLFGCSLYCSCSWPPGGARRRRMARLGSFGWLGHRPIYFVSKVPGTRILISSLNNIRVQLIICDKG
jgi:hypothetical protein